jgi:hypothetical protein
MPTHDECRDDGLIATGRRAEEIDNRDLALHGIPKPAVIRGLRVGAHECVINHIITCVDLVMRLALIVIPDTSAPPRKHGLNAQQVFHLPGLEDSALRVNQRNALAPELKPAREIGGSQDAASEDSKLVHVAERRLA